MWTVAEAADNAPADKLARTMMVACQGCAPTTFVKQRHVKTACKMSLKPTLIVEALTAVHVVTARSALRHRIARAISAKAATVSRAPATMERSTRTNPTKTAGVCAMRATTRANATPQRTVRVATVTETSASHATTEFKTETRPRVIAAAAAMAALLDRVA